MDFLKFVYAVLFLALFSCKSVESPVYVGTEDLQIQSLGVKESILGAKIKFYNPNTKSLQLRNANIEVFLKKRFLGKVSIDSVINLPAKKFVFVPIRTAINMKNIISNASYIFLKDSIEVDLVGTLQAGMHGLYKKVPIQYHGKLATRNIFKDSLR